MARNTLKNPYSDFKDKLRGTSTAQPTRTVVTDTSPGRKPKNASKYAKTLMKQADQKESRRSQKTANKGMTENPLTKSRRETKRNSQTASNNGGMAMNRTLIPKNGGMAMNRTLIPKEETKNRLRKAIKK